MKTTKYFTPPSFGLACFTLIWSLGLGVVSPPSSTATPAEKSSVINYDSDNLIPGATREATLRRTGKDFLNPTRLDVLFYDYSEERDMVDAAVDYFAKYRIGLDAFTQACLWEQLSLVVNRSLGQPVFRISRGYRWRHEGKFYYVYQGPLALGQRGRHATIVIAPDGTAFNGLADKIRDIDTWDLNLYTLRPILPN
jgi:hypothetical protein